MVSGHRSAFNTYLRDQSKCALALARDSLTSSPTIADAKALIALFRSATTFINDANSNGLPGAILKQYHPESEAYHTVTGKRLTWGDFKELLRCGLLISEIPDLPHDFQYVAQLYDGKWNHDITGFKYSVPVSMVDKLRLAVALVKAKKAIESLGIDPNLTELPTILLYSNRREHVLAETIDDTILVTPNQIPLLNQSSLDNLLLHEYVHIVRNRRTGNKHRPQAFMYTTANIVFIYGLLDHLFEEGIATYAAEVFHPSVPDEKETAIKIIEMFLFAKAENGKIILPIKTTDGVIDLIKSSCYTPARLAAAADIPRETKLKILGELLLREGSAETLVEFYDRVGFPIRAVFGGFNNPFIIEISPDQVLQT